MPKKTRPRNNDPRTSAADVQVEQTGKGKRKGRDSVSGALSELSSAAIPQAPDGRVLELKITARPDHIDGVWKEDSPQYDVRDVVLCEMAACGDGARSFILYHPNCSLATVRRICLWAEILHISIVQDPPGNLEAGYRWLDKGGKPFDPDDAPPGASSFLDGF